MANKYPALSVGDLAAEAPNQQAKRAVVYYGTAQVYVVLSQWYHQPRRKVFFVEPGPMKVFRL